MSHNNQQSVITIFYLLVNKLMDMITQKIGAPHGFDANSVFCPTNGWIPTYPIQIKASYISWYFVRVGILQCSWKGIKLKCWWGNIGWHVVVALVNNAFCFVRVRWYERVFCAARFQRSALYLGMDSNISHSNEFIIRILILCDISTLIVPIFTLQSYIQFFC